MGIRKYDYAFKLKAVEKVAKGNPIVSTAAALGVHKHVLRKWWDYYQVHGKDGLKPVKNRNSGDFKVKVLEAYHEEKLSLMATCVRFRLSGATVLQKWLSIEKNEGRAGLYEEKRGKSKRMKSKKKSDKKPVPKTREQELEEQLKELKLENEYLKKLHALIQQKESTKERKHK